MNRPNKISIVLILVMALPAILFLLIYDIKFNYDSYDILFHNRISKLGFGIMYKKGFEVWQFAHTVHGGMAEKRFYPFEN